MNENQLTIVKEYEFDKPLIQKIDSIIDNCYRDCYSKYYHTFENKCEYDFNFTNITNNETVNFTISDKSMGLFKLNKKLTVARERDFIFNQIKKCKNKIYSYLSNINICYYLKHRIPMCHRHFFRKLAENPDLIQIFCNDRRNTFHFACRRWYLYINSHCDKVQLHKFQYK